MEQNNRQNVIDRELDHHDAVDLPYTGWFQCWLVRSGVFIVLYMIFYTLVVPPFFETKNEIDKQTLSSDIMIVV